MRHLILLSLPFFLLAGSLRQRRAFRSLTAPRALAYTRQYVADRPALDRQPRPRQRRRPSSRSSSATISWKRTPSPRTRRPGRCRCTTSSCVFPGKRTASSFSPRTTRPTTRCATFTYVGANDGGSTTGLLIEMANYLRGKTLDGYSVLAALHRRRGGGEKLVRRRFACTAAEHLAEKWQADGTLQAHQGVHPRRHARATATSTSQRDQNSTPWLEDLVYQAASEYGWQSYFFAKPRPSTRTTTCPLCIAACPART